MYKGVAVTDDDGKTMGRTVQVKVRLEIKGDEATFDFSGSDDRAEGFINAPIHKVNSWTLCTACLLPSSKHSPLDVDGVQMLVTDARHSQPRHRDEQTSG